MTRKIITDKKDLYFFGIDLGEMTLEDLSEKTAELIAVYGKDAYIDIEYYEHDGGCDLYLYFKRYETDAEYKKRVESEEKERTKKAKQKAEKEERDKQEYERLKKKFGDA